MRAIIYNKKTLSRLGILRHLADHDTLLDIGCGYGFRSLEVCSKVKDVVSLDLSHRFLMNLKKRLKKCNNLHLILSTAEVLPFRSCSFKKILLLDVLEHLQDDTESLLETFHVLKIEGLIFIKVPHYKIETIALTLDPMWNAKIGHLRKYNPKRLKELLEDCGFHVLMLTFENFFHAIYITIEAKLRLGLEAQSGMIKDKTGLLFQSLWRLLEPMYNLSPIVLLDNLFGRLLLPSSILIIAKKNASQKQRAVELRALHINFRGNEERIKSSRIS